MHFDLTDPATREQLAWMAGFIDGEGCISLSRQRDKRKGPNYYAYRPMLQITNVYREPLDSILATVEEGQICKSIRPSGNHSDTYQYKLRRHETLLELLVALRPFLKLKHQQAELVIYFILRRLGRTADRPFVRGWFRPYDSTDHALYLRSRKLNIRGKESQNVVTSAAV